MGALTPGSDTPPEVVRRMTELWRAATPSQKLEKVFGIGRMINELARAELKQRYPDATPREIDLRLASRVLDRDTMIRAFGWDPDEQGR
jgi:HEPN domain-containing protein